MTDWYQDVHDLNQRRIPVATVTVIRGDGIGNKLVVTVDSVRGSLGNPELDGSGTTLAMSAIASGKSEVTELSAGVDVFVESFPVSRQLIIVGAVHIAQALVPIAKSLGFYIVVVDARQQLATRERFPDVDDLMVAWPDEAFGKLSVSKRDAIAILTHDPKFDEPALLSALATDAAYIGAVGSRSTAADRRDRLKAAGASDEQIARVHGPIGLDIGGKSPEEMAISIMAEVIAVINGRTGRSLAAASGTTRT